jgi:signal peptidase I
VSLERSSWKDRIKIWRRPRRKRGRKTRRERLTEYLITLAVAFVLIFGFVRPFVVEPFWIPSESMLPTLEVGDRVFVNKFIYRFTRPERGDIVVFKSLEGEDEDLIKRVVAVRGDRVRVINGVLLVNGERQDESYIKVQFPDGSDFGPTKIGKGEVYVMGDNRGNSRDSRFFGPVPIDDIEGEAFFRFWPLWRIGLL